MSKLKHLDEVIFEPNNIDQNQITNIVDEALSNSDDGELFLEYSQSENFTFDDGAIKNTSFNTSQGFGLRSVVGEVTGYAHSSEISEKAIRAAMSTTDAVRSGKNIHTKIDNSEFSPIRRDLYVQESPLLQSPSFEQKLQLMYDIDSYLRKQDQLVKQVSVSLSGEMQSVRIIRENGLIIDDCRPLVRLNVSVITEKNGRMERGSYGMGGRFMYDNIVEKEIWQKSANKALQQALVNLESIPAPAGEMPVVLGSGWPGVLLHEAVGHGLEGDFNRKKTSSFSGLVGQRVASKGVTVVDDGTIEQRRGSLQVDDEGTSSGCTTLIEDGILKGYMFDRLNARLMGTKSTGNGRRESYAHQPMPRMTNTYMLPGDKKPEEIIASVKKGLYAVNFGGGQVDITSGKFVFSASEAYLIEDGKVTTPVKGATLIGNGPDVLTKVSMIGDDLKLDDGVGTCGKAGQSVPVGVGQPTMLVDQLTVGGTETS